LWLEARTAMLQGKLRHGAAAMSARDALEIATRGGAACLGRTGEIGQLSVGACGDLAVWSLEGVRFAGALSDPVEAWLRCGPVSARQTVVGGRLVVDDGAVVHPGLDEQLAVHRRVSQRMQAALA
ncbi:MAG: Cytosine deaminase, partial [Modestobacter sp.]|nr:Cytosine deaminase [Modestobacter sp.]